VSTALILLMGHYPIVLAALFIGGSFEGNFFLQLSAGVWVLGLPSFTALSK
jgi:hypothetical protein